MIVTTEWAIGVGISLAALIGGIMVRDRQVMKTIEQGDQVLHGRINDVKEDYVRRDDLVSHVKPMETMVALLRDEQRATNRRIDKLLAILAHGANNDV